MFLGRVQVAVKFVYIGIGAAVASYLGEFSLINFPTLAFRINCGFISRSQVLRGTIIIIFYMLFYILKYCIWV